LATSEKLKSYTQSNHQQLEKTLIGKMRNIQTKTQYIDLLQLFYNYFEGIEAQISQYIGAEQLEDYLERRKTNMLVNDIEALGGSVKRIIEVEDLPKYENQLQAFGALYVLEGSTLGGSHISKMIRKQLQQHDDLGLSFFNSYGDQTEFMWHKFKAALDMQAQNESQQVVILQSADETFLRFRSWIEKQTILN
jgi:heme oxygenase